MAGRLWQHHGQIQWVEPRILWTLMEEGALSSCLQASSRHLVGHSWVSDDEPGGPLNWSSRALVKFLHLPSPYATCHNQRCKVREPFWKVWEMPQGGRKEELARIALSMLLLLETFAGSNPLLWMGVTWTKILLPFKKGHLWIQPNVFIASKSAHGDTELPWQLEFTASEASGLCTQ